MRANTEPWITYTFEVRKDGHLSIGGDVVFNSEERANGRRFDVAGKIYVAELFCSTSGQQGGKHGAILTKLHANEIVIWDEATANARNAPLSNIWRSETIDPAARYSVPSAYANGVLLLGFTPKMNQMNNGLWQLKPNSLEVERVSVLSDERSAPNTATQRSYGDRADISAAAARYTDMTVVLVSRSENYRPNPNLPSVTFTFKAHGVSSPGDSFSFTTYNFANGTTFDVGGKTYLAEMFSTTATEPATGSKTKAKDLSLDPIEIVVWSPETARERNPRIISSFSYGIAERYPTRKLAAGVRLSGGFTSSIVIGVKNDPKNGWANLDELDAPLEVLYDSLAVYPSKFSGSGLIGNVGGYLFVQPDGTVGFANATHGDEKSFAEPCEMALRSMHFYIPMRAGWPTKVLLNFSWSLTERTPGTTSVNFNYTKSVSSPPLMPRVTP